jgi:hypothetical protein
MNYPTLQKVTLTTLALVASLAISARGGTATVSSAKQTHGPAKSVNPIHRLLFPASTYMIDDGSAEDAVGLTIGGDVICLNEFAVLPGSETITSISIAWGTPVFPDPSLDGLSYTAVIWSDPNGDGSPTDAVVLATAPGTVSAQGTDTFLTTNITPTTITGANFFVGYIIQDTFGGQFPCSFDETNPTLSNRSFIAGGATGDINNLNNNDLPVAPIESFGLIGNWLVRADAGAGGGIVLEGSVRRQGGNRFVVLSWSPADGGSVNVLRNGVVRGTTADDGAFQSNIHAHTGTDTYQVCETDSGDCSNVVTVTTH